MLIKFLDGSSREVVTLRLANPSGVNLSCANLSGADLSGADLSGADLRSAYLSGADLRSADLSYADLSCADLRSAYLSCADLRSANLSGADLSGAHLSGAKGLAQLSICPAGTLYGYKKLADNQVITLLIPSNAKRLNAYGSRKCRAEFAFVHEMNGVSQSRHYSAFKYRIGETVRPTEPFCDDPRIECASGIHFFITREEALAY